MAGIVNKVYLAKWKVVIYSMGTKNNDFKKRWIVVLDFCDFLGPGGGVTAYDGLYGEASQERVTFFRLQVYKEQGLYHLGL